MQDTQIAHHILFDLEKSHKLPHGYEANSQIISEVVEGWNRHIYVVHNQAIKLQHRKTKKYILM